MNQKNYIIINSDERINPDSEVSDAIYQLPHGFKGRKKDYCKLIKFQLANTFYNVTTSNNTFIYNGGNILIDEGNYNLSELFTWLVTNTAIVSISYNDITCKVTITLPNPADTLAFPTINSAHGLFGFNQSYNAAGVSHVGVRPPAVFDLEIFMEIEGMSSQYITTNPKMSFMPTFIIPNNVNKNNFNLFYEKTHFSQISKVMELSKQFRIRLKNQKNELLKCCSDYTLIISFIEVCC